MAEWKLFSGDRAEVSTAEFHAHRERAAHLEQPSHRPRLELAAGFVREAADRLQDSAVKGMQAPLWVDVSDLGCGDGGLLSLLKQWNDIDAWGYDFAPANAAGWAERGVRAELLDVFNAPGIPLNSPNRDIELGDIVVMTEVLEHLTDPHGVLRELHADSAPGYLVVSSPFTEHAGSHDACHAWAWDAPGYRDLLMNNGWQPIRHQHVDQFQVVLAERSVIPS